MKKNVKFFGRSLVLLFVLGACQSDNMDDDGPIVPPPESNFDKMIKSYNNEMVLKWNSAFSTAIDNITPTAAESRSYAMVTLVVHDALNNIVPKYETYAMDHIAVLSKEVSDKNIAQIADAAVAQAAYEVSIVVFPSWKDLADQLLAESLSKIEESALKSLGIEIGEQAAMAILEKRKNDIVPMFVTYDQGTLPGEYRSSMPFSIANPPVWPENAAYAPDWGNLEPFGMISGDQFRPGPPYQINSQEYTTDYNEVKNLGCNNCPDRTQEQLEIGTFFIENSPSAMNRLSRAFAVDGKFNGWETARLLALTAMVQADAHISVFEAKYFYNSWRPITAIRGGDMDGNEDTVGDPNWAIPQSPGVRPTPPVPSYPSSHAANGGAGAELYKLYFENDNKTFSSESLSLPNVTRNYTSFSQLADENSLSRIYVGYHFRQDVIEGEKMGRQLAEFVFKNNLREHN